MTARCAQRTRRHAERHLRVAEVEVLNEERGELDPGNVRRLRVPLALTEGHEVIAPRDELPVRIDTTFEVVIPAGPIHLVPHVVFARPQQLDGNARDLLRDRRRFSHVVVGEPAAEPAARLHHVQRDVGILDPCRPRRDTDASLRRLARRPDLELSVLELRDAVLGLER